MPRCWLARTSAEAGSRLRKPGSQAHRREYVLGQSTGYRRQYCFHHDERGRHGLLRYDDHHGHSGHAAEHGGKYRVRHRVGGSGGGPVRNSISEWPGNIHDAIRRRGSFGVEFGLHDGQQWRGLIQCCSTATSPIYALRLFGTAGLDSGNFLADVPAGFN